MEEVTAIFFSCTRTGLLKRTVDAFIEHNGYPLYDIIIVNDSADPKIWEALKRDYPDFKLILNPQNVGLYRSIDNAMSVLQTPWYFLCEDDWMITKGGFIEKSLAIMTDHPEIEEVWLKDYNKHPMDAEIYESNGIKYRLAEQGTYKGIDGYDEGWHGFATACSLKRKSDYLKVAPYANIDYHGSWNKPVTAWHKEYAIGLEYHKLGYRTAVLIDDEYATNIGMGQSEYVAGQKHVI